MHKWNFYLCNCFGLINKNFISIFERLHFFKFSFILIFFRFHLCSILNQKLIYFLSWGIFYLLSYYWISSFTNSFFWSLEIIFYCFRNFNWKNSFWFVKIFDFWNYLAQWFILKFITRLFFKFFVFFHYFNNKGII